MNPFLFLSLSSLTYLERPLDWKCRGRLLLFLKYRAGDTRVVYLINDCLRNFESSTFPLIIFRINKNRLPPWFWLLLSVLFLFILDSSHFGKSNDKWVTWIYFLDFDILFTVLLSLSKGIELFLIDLGLYQILLLSLRIILVFLEWLKCLSIVNIQIVWTVVLRFIFLLCFLLNSVVFSCHFQHLFCHVLLVQSFNLLARRLLCISSLCPSWSHGLWILIKCV